MDLCQVNPEFNLYDPEWPLRTYQPQAPPAKFVFAEQGRRCGQALDSVISGGCIISGSRVSGSILCPNVRVHSFCEIEQSILMPGVRVGRHARLSASIVDRDVLIPRGALIGFNAEEDRRRHTVTEGGVVVVTADDEPLIGPISEEALRAEADRSGDASERESGRESMNITRIHGREILDSRGNPTVEVDLWAGEAFGRAAVPSGASTGEREALELRDGDKRRYLGKGVRNAVAHVNGEIAAALRGRPLDQRAIDAAADRARRHADQEPPRRQCAARRLDGGRQGGRGRARGSRSTSTSPSLSGAGADDDQYLLPVPMMNILNGGAHADSSVDLQEFMVMPVGMPTFAEALRAGTEIFHALRAILKKAGHSTGVGDEGGFAPNLKSNREALDLVARGDRQGGLPRRAGRVSRARRRGERVVGRRPLRLQEVGRADAHAGPDGRDVRRLGSPVSDHLDRRRRRRGRLGRLEGADARARRSQSSSSATTCS